MLADEAMAAALVPWACPCEFGPDGRYQLEELIAFGRRSFVYRARDSRLSSSGFDAHVAIKITPRNPMPAVASSSEPVPHVVGPEGDALAARRVTHPNVLQILDRGEDATGAKYLVAEFVDGGTLADRSAPWAPKDAAALVAILAHAVQAAHMAGVVHCDLKPANILLTKQGEPKLADFDLSFSPVNRDETHRGNLAFMSPEQFNQDENSLTPAADVYGLGGILFWLLTGEFPHGTTADEIVAFHRTQQRVRLPAIDSDLAMICGKAMERQRSNRYLSALGLAADLENWIAGRPIEWTRPSPWKRSWLLVRRNSLRTGLVLAALLASGAGAYITYDKTIGAKQRELATQAKMNANTQKELDAVRARLKFVMRTVSAAIGSGGSGSVERVLPSLFWMEFLRGQIVANAKGDVELPPQRIEGLEQIVQDADTRGTAMHTDMLMARFALTGYLVDAGRGSDALEQVQWMEAHWVPTLDPEDVVVLGVATLRQCAEIELDALRLPSTKPLIARLQSLRQRLIDDGRSASMVGIVERVVKRIKPTAKDAAGPS